MSRMRILAALLLATLMSGAVHVDGHSSHPVSGAVPHAAQSIKYESGADHGRELATISPQVSAGHEETPAPTNPTDDHSCHIQHCSVVLPQMTDLSTPLTLVSNLVLIKFNSPVSGDFLEPSRPPQT